MATTAPKTLYGNPIKIIIIIVTTDRLSPVKDILVVSQSAKFPYIYYSSIKVASKQKVTCERERKQNPK